MPIGMEMKLQIKLTQQLVMTPQLVQAIRLLQLSRLELVDEVRKELDGNPVLADETIEPNERPNRNQGETGERTSAQDSPAPREPSEASGAEAPPAATAEPTGETAAQTAEPTEAEKSNDVDWDRYLENQQLRQPVGSSRSGFEDLPPIEHNLTKPSNLHDHLLWQLQLSDFVDTERHFALLVIGNLNEKGYLDLEGGIGPDGETLPDLTLDVLAAESGLDPEDADEVLALIQRFDPVGVAARNLQECLMVQAEVLGFDEIDKAIISNHLRDVERRNLNAIVKALDISLEDVIESVQEIQKLESVPARNFSEVDERTIAITPDVFVIKDNDKLVVTDNDRGMQRLYINETLVKKMLRDPKAKEFINDKLRSAQWLIRAIEQRRRTIIKVTECIVDKQREFLEGGIAYLKPMILRDVAEAVGMHESTISRVTSNKYVHTPQGLFELKYFFNSSISRVGDEDIASESVKQAIKGIISEEDKAKPLSDQAIVKKLKTERNIRIARRTVAKYREMLGILSSAKRKKLYQLASWSWYRRSVFSPDVRFEGFTHNDWQRVLELFRPLRPEGQPRDPERAEGLVIAVHGGGRLRKLLHTRVGRLRLDDLAAHWPIPVEELARRHDASWALSIEVGALDDVMMRLGAAAHRSDDLTTQWLTLLNELQRQMSLGRIELWPHRLEGIPMPTKQMLDRTLDTVAPAGKTMLVGLFDRDELWTSIALTRGEQGFELVLGPDELRRDLGLLSGDFHRDYRHLARLVSDYAGPLSLGCFADYKTFRNLEVDPTPGAWALAVAVRDVVLHPVPTAMALPLGVDAGRAVFSALRQVAARIDPEGVLTPALSVIRDVTLGKVPIEEVLGFSPLELLRKLLSREI